MASTPAPTPKSGTPNPPKPAVYGRACVSCAKAKCRCTRLKTDCIASEASRRRTKAIATTRLEEKVDGILSLLKSKSASDGEALTGVDFTLHDLDFRLRKTASQEDIPKNISATPATLDDTSRNNTDSGLTTLKLPSNAANTYSMLNGKHSSLPSHPSTSSLNGFGPVAFSSTTSFVFDIPLLEAETYLSYFRSQILPHFAFIYIPPETTVQGLQQTRPFLFLTIMAVSSSSHLQRQRLGREIKQRIAQETLSETEGSLDVLLGLLVLLTWGHDQLLATHLASRFTQLAISMLFDLRLNKAPAKESATYSLFNLGVYEVGNGPKTRTMEERRAALGCWMLSSFISWYFVKIDPLRWTPYLDECVHILSHEPESPTDRNFATQVRLQLIADKTADYASSISKNTSDERGNSKSSLTFYIHALSAELREINLGLSTEDENDATLQSYFHHTALSITALALSPSSSSPSALVPHPSQTQSRQVHPSTSRLESLSQCLTSLQDFFNLFFVIPPSQYVSLSFPRFTHLAHAIVILYHVSIFNDPGWDRGAVRERCDIERVLDVLVSGFGSLRRVPVGGFDGVEKREGEEEFRDRDGEIDMSAKLAWIFAKAGAWVKRKLAIHNASSQDRQGGHGAGTADGLGTGMHEHGRDGGGMNDLGVGLDVGLDFGGDYGDVSMMNGVDEAWLSEVLGPWSYEFS